MDRMARGTVWGRLGAPPAGYAYAVELVETAAVSAAYAGDLARGRAGKEGGHHGHVHHLGRRGGEAGLFSVRRETGKE